MTKSDSRRPGTEESLKPSDKNGFTVINVTPEGMVFTMLTWRLPQAIEETETMKPALTNEVTNAV